MVADFIPLIVVSSGEPAGIGVDICLDIAKYNGAIDNIAIVNNNPAMNDNKAKQHALVIVIADVNLLKQRMAILSKQSSLTQTAMAIKANQKIVIYTVNEDQLLNHPKEYKSELLARSLSLKQLKSNCLFVLHKSVANYNCCGKIDINNSPYVLALLDAAVNLCQQCIAQAMVTAPLHKAIINDYYKSIHSPLLFTGHTEYLANKFHVKQAIMLMVNVRLGLRVALFTTHIPLKMVPRMLTRLRFKRSLQLLIHECQDKLSIANPRIAVCGLNPHAGECGYIGKEEQDILKPIIEEYSKCGYLVSGCYSPDTIFNRANEFDIIFALYHDQALPVIKYAGFIDSVNVTLGLPVIRVSVDHGTALELAGSAKASSVSLMAALNYAFNYVCTTSIQAKQHSVMASHSVNTKLKHGRTKQALRNE